MHQCWCFFFGDCEMARSNDTGPNQADLDNHANQLNPEHDAYWQSRGEDERPEDYEDRLNSD